MTEISIRDLTSEGSLVYYTIIVTKSNGEEWIYDGHATSLDGAFQCIAHNLKRDYPESANA
jgi:hypothetical protein